MTGHNELPSDLINDFYRNRDGRLSSRQWIALITEPLSALLLLSVPLILLAGRYGAAGRLIVLALVAAFAITIVMRAWKFARAQLCYRVLFAEQAPARWRFWKQTTLVSKAGEAVRFERRLGKRLKLEAQQSLHVYYIESGGRRIMLTMLPRNHPSAEIAEPSSRFQRAGGKLFAD
ncbi:MAG: hypothetical protein OXG92_12070 [Chloroflexi bacterium]|nr:hypothetical protein [Chloroflexota bacterium]MCY3584042.1 hypothetical protein [Chloroflexota bacterium]MCY3717190.1 hypothetical protein [Chloroflexota bacterium]MDE2651796.1 hypothetical protein [Chloroflexota bacterium]MXV92833.1 hypothetical protein [Chloroflexota bacterium]